MYLKDQVCSYLGLTVSNAFVHISLKNGRNNTSTRLLEKHNKLRYQIIFSNFESRSRSGVSIRVTVGDSSVCRENVVKEEKIRVELATSPK